MNNTMQEVVVTSISYSKLILSSPFNFPFPSIGLESDLKEGVKINVSIKGVQQVPTVSSRENRSPVIF